MADDFTFSGTIEDKMNDNENGLKKLKRSKRFWSALGTLIAAIATAILEVEIDPTLIVGIGVALLGGYALEDYKQAGGISVTKNNTDMFNIGECWVNETTKERVMYTGVGWTKMPPSND